MELPFPFKPVRKRGSLSLDSHFVWGASPVFADNLYHLFFATSGETPLHRTRNLVFEIETK